MSWSAKQYSVFEAERTRPVRDLLAALPDIAARSVIDLGCGPGNSTEMLAVRFPGAEVEGIDNSADMIGAARRRLPQLQFSVMGIEEWLGSEVPASVETRADTETRLGMEAPMGVARAGAEGRNDSRPFDVILANAVLQWVPNHAGLLPRLVGRLAAGGALAIQMPDNLDTPVHRLMREIAADGPWARKLETVSRARTPLADADWYYELLRPVCGGVDVWRTTYHHPLAGGAAAVVEWFKGSGLRPFLEPLDDSERGEYLRRYTAGIAGTYRSLPDGSVLLPFPRLFLAAIR